MEIKTYYTRGGKRVELSEVTDSLVVVMLYDFTKSWSLDLQRWEKEIDTVGGTVRVEGYYEQKVARLEMEGVSAALEARIRDVVPTEMKLSS